MTTLPKHLMDLLDNTQDEKIRDFEMEINKTQSTDRDYIIDTIDCEELL